MGGTRDVSPDFLRAFVWQYEIFEGRWMREGCSRRGVDVEGGVPGVWPRYVGTAGDSDMRSGACDRRCRRATREWAWEWEWEWSGVGVEWSGSGVEWS